MLLPLKDRLYNIFLKKNMRQINGNKIELLDMSIYEIYWINKYNPIHNKQDNYDGHNSKLNLSELFPSKIINIDDLINFNFDLSMFDDIIRIIRG